MLCHSREILYCSFRSLGQVFRSQGTGRRVGGSKKKPGSRTASSLILVQICLLGLRCRVNRAAVRETRATHMGARAHMQFKIIGFVTFPLAPMSSQISWKRLLFSWRIFRHMHIAHTTQAVHKSNKNKAYHVISPCSP